MDPSTTPPPFEFVPAEQGEIVLYHFETRLGMTTRPAIVTHVNEDDGGSADLRVFLGGPLDVDIANDLGSETRVRVRGATTPVLWCWTAR